MMFDRLLSSSSTCNRFTAGYWLLPKSATSLCQVPSSTTIGHHHRSFRKCTSILICYLNKIYVRKLWPKATPASLNRSAEPKLHIQDYLQETMEVDGFVASLETFRRAADSLRYRANHPPSPREQPPSPREQPLSPREQPSSPREQPSSPRDHPRAVFLGTGSCIPSKTRNTSAIHLQLE